MAQRIKVSEEFSKTPGARYKTDGNFSGEQFLDELLKPCFEVAMNNSEQLVVDLDGGYGYATSFLEESFGGLARAYGIDKVKAIIVIISEDEPSLRDEITRYVSNALNKLPKVGEHA